MKKEIVINSTEYETRVAIIEDGLLVELQVERPDAERMVGDIYKGRVNSVLPGMQAAFVDIGYEKGAYLHSSDVGKIWDRGEAAEVTSENGEEAPAEIVRKRRRQGIETVLKQGQEVLVQVIKEPIGTKGPRLATEISLPGRYLVLVPDDDTIRVSRRITNWGEKRRLRKLVSPIRPEGFGFIVRTEAEGVEEHEIKADVKRLMKLWTKLKRKSETESSPALIHKEAEMLISMIRDVFTEDVTQLVCDDRNVYKKVISFARQVAPELKDRVKLYKGSAPLFDQYNLEPEIDKMLSRKVWIRKGAYLVIDQTEAMVTIDVNTGRFVGSKDIERTIFQTNLLAAREIARQIRLRDIGGLIVCDFIDMAIRDNRRKLYEEFKSAFRYDRAKRGINPVTDFGLVEMTRERVRPSHMTMLSEPCPCCDGTGRIIARENLAMKIERWFHRARADRKYRDFHLVVHPAVAEVLADNGSSRLDRIKRAYRFSINLIRDTTLDQSQFRIFEAASNSDISETYTRN